MITGADLGCDAVIYRHFAALTERFLAPLNRYFGTLWAGNEAVAARCVALCPCAPVLSKPSLERH